MNTQKRIVELGYSPGHPWYYTLGGRVLYPREILESVKLSGYQGCRREDIENADKKVEPQRSECLRKLQSQALASYHANLSIYRERALQLHILRKETGLVYAGSSSRDIDMSMSLKHNHLYNDFAHMIWLDELLNRQLDLFG